MALVGGCLAVASWLGCGQLLGIEDFTPGVPDGGSDAGSDADATVHVGPDASGSDAPPDSIAPVEASAAPPVACTVVPLSTMEVDDLSARDGGPATYIPTLGIFPLRDDPATFTVVAQLFGDGRELLGYTVTFGQPSAPPQSLTGLFADGGIALVGAIADHPGGFGNAVMTTYTSGQLATGLETGLQVIALPNRRQDPFLGVGYPVANLGPVSVDTAAFAQTSASSAAWIATGREHSALENEVLVGAGDADGGSGELVVSHSTQDLDSLGTPQIFVMQGQIFAMLPGWVPGGTTVFEEPLSLSSDPGTQGIITSPDAEVFAFETHQSVLEPLMAVAVAVTQSSDGTFATYGAVFPPQLLNVLAVGQSPFVRASSLLPGDFPHTSTSTAWFEDELFLFGVPAVVTEPLAGAALLWLGRDGHVVSTSSSSGLPIVASGHPIVGTAVAAQDVFGEARADLVVAWIERVTSDAGGQYDTLWTERVVCQPASPGGD
jgi:hypothetical protein